jgi:NADH-quinone oxidoreductase subunit E
MELIEDLKSEFDEIVGRSATRCAALLPILYKVQEKKGFLTENTLEEVAEYLQISRSEAFEVATFFALFYEEYIGENIFLVCENISCYLVGGESVLEALEKETGAKIGGNSPDGVFTIRAFSCLGACDKAPNLLLNGELHSNLTVESVKKLVKDCRSRKSD